MLLKSGVGTLVFLHYGRTKKLIGDLSDIDLEELKRLIRIRLKRRKGRAPGWRRNAQAANAHSRIYSLTIVKRY